MSIAMGLLATLFVGLRVWARTYTRIKHGLDDSIVISAMLFIYGFIVIAVYRGGSGKHLAANLMAEPRVFSRAVLYLSVGDILYATSIALLKASILVMYCRIFPLRSMKVGGYSLGVIVLMWWIAVCLLAIFQCRPVRKAWGMSTTEGTCIDKGIWFTSVAVPNIVTDVAILALPVRQVSLLRLSRARKMAVSGIFLLGGFVVIVSCLRLRCLLDLRGGEDGDFTRLVACVWWWSDVEISIGCVSACLPTLRPLARLLVGLFRRHTMSNRITDGLNNVETIGCARSRHPQDMTGNGVESCEHLGDEGAPTADLNLRQGHSNEVSTVALGNQDSHLQS
ncbi:hypothetical protein FOQG_16603 [Fusarium oxysporum f. sp. raphani 54005]|uniref:Rhodopsin domain-containing protein n=3 Tax=Fusarium oxysporum TaxID=5507 RepID=X0C7R6_FUSOX|nr:hypothetical protein FOQG_16603 [Fusarium oxysporum f. sp. raphani 54005]KAI8402119.1 hypothetical protein FOFC_17424 [Fusarium oxysporum]KAJ9413255.1 hypothetical protein QL093DRAFT_2107853 [Fusarium oxysporum]